MRKNKIVIFLLVLSINSIAQEKWTLEKCVNRAIKKNISIKQSSEELKSNQLNKKTAIGNFMPSLNFPRLEYRFKSKYYNRLIRKYDNRIIFIKCKYWNRHF